MKTFLQTLFFFLLITQICFAQWEGDQQLTNTASSSFLNNNNAWNIAVSGDTIHVIYADDFNGAFQVYYTSSYNAGINWDAPLLVSTVVSNIWSYVIAVSGLTVHVVWINTMANQFLYIHSSDAGVTFSQPDTILTTTQNLSFPCLAVNGNDVYLVWNDNRHPVSNDEIYFMSSVDGGLNWNTPQRLTNTGNGIMDKVPSLAISDNILHLVWQRGPDYQARVLYRRSSNNGVSWEPEQFITSDTINQTQPCIAVSGSYVHTAWMDSRNDTIQIFYRSSYDNGVNWQVEKCLTNGFSADYETITASGKNVHIAYRDYRFNQQWHIGYRCSIDNGLTWQQDTVLINSWQQEGPSIAVAGTKVHLIWMDNRDGNWEIYYKKNPNGNPTKVENISLNFPTRFQLYGNYPNPFNPSTKIKYSVQQTSQVQIKIFDVLGNDIVTLVNEEKPAGTYESNWNAANLPSGVYFYRLQAGDFMQTRKMILLK